MPQSARTIAKLAAPRLEGAVRRARLHALLGERCNRPVVWVVGPPGAGKTTLVASFLAEAAIPTLWYRVDSGDADPATFFYYLRRAVQTLTPPEARPLPLLTPEYLADISGFARRWFREAFQQLPAGCVLVLDNFQDAGEDLATHRALAAAWDELPQGSNAIVVSRRDPPAPFAQAQLNGLISAIGWEDLRLSPEETAVVAASRGLVDVTAARSVQQQSNGWMAGVVLMSERFATTTGSATGIGTDTLETVFDYFAGLAFDSADARIRDVLVRTSLLPSVTAATAEAATGDQGAIDVLDGLFRRNLFVDRAVALQRTYRFHPLFQSFLQARAGSMLSPGQRSAIAARAARLFHAEGDVDQAFMLFADAGQWDDAERVLLSNAQRLIDQGRWRTLDEWIERFRTAGTSNAWLDYWHGRSRLTVAPGAAEPLLAQAYASFLRCGNAVGQMLSAVGVIESLYLEYCNFAAMDEWHARVTALLEQGVTPPSPDDELRTNAVVMVGCCYRFIEYRKLDDCVNRVKLLLSAATDPNLRVAAAGMLHAYVMTSLDRGVEAFAQQAGRALLGLQQVTAQRAAHYLAMEGYGHYLMGRFDVAADVLSDAERIAENHGLDELGCLIRTWLALTELRAGRIDSAAQTLERCNARRKPVTGPTAVLLDMAAIWIDFARGRTARVVPRMQAVRDHFERTGQHVGCVPVGWLGAHMALAMGDLAGARDFLGRVQPYMSRSAARYMIGTQQLLESWLHHHSGDTARRDDCLREAMARAGDGRSGIRYRWYPRALEAMLPVAIDRDIEGDTARGLVREFDVLPPAPGLPNWPWPVKVFTLGRFELLVDDRPAEYSRKSPRRLLELLKAIVAFGALEVDERKLADALWPDDDGGNALHALRVSLARLRKLLGHGDAIQVTDGKVSLDPKRCWVDALAFERTVSGPGSADPGRIERACRLYRGTFLGGDADHPWILPMRERLRTRFVEHVEMLGAEFESAGALDRAAAWYQRGIDADPLIEAFHQGLVRCHMHLGRRAEALGAYRRLRQTLSVVLGITPSASSEALYRALYESEPARQSVANS